MTVNPLTLGDAKYDFRELDGWSSLQGGSNEFQHNFQFDLPERELVLIVESSKRKNRNVGCFESRFSRNVSFALYKREYVKFC